METVPERPSIYVERPVEWLEPAAVSKRRLNRFEAALHYVHHFEAQTAEALLEVYPTWANGKLSPYVVQALGNRGEGVARHVLPSEHHSRTARVTALRLLAAARAHDALTQSFSDALLNRLASDAVRGQTWRIAAGDELIDQVLNAGKSDTRAQAIRLLSNGGNVEAIPVIREAWFRDAAAPVRYAAARGLADLLDSTMVDEFCRAVRERQKDDDLAKAAAYALGIMGDVRGIDTLLDAFAEAWKPAVMQEALAAWARMLAPCPELHGPLAAEISARPPSKALTGALKALGLGGKS